MTAEAETELTILLKFHPWKKSEKDDLDLLGDFEQKNIIAPSL